MESLFLPQWGAFLRYHDLPGKSPTRVYLHGLAISSSSASFTNVAMHPDLAGHRSLLVDFLGFGFSDRPPDFSYTHEDQAYAIAGLLDRLDLRDCAFVGHSMGGSVAISLAALRPELVSRLVVAEGNLDPGGGQTSKRVAEQSEREFVSNGYKVLLEDIKARAESGESGLAAFAGMLQVAAPHAFHRSAVALVKGTQPTVRQRFYELLIPRAYVFGERSVPKNEGSAVPDAPYPLQLEKEGIQIFVVPDAGHLMVVENPKGFGDVVREALKS